MTDAIVKIYSYENRDFVEIPETYYSTDSNDITFIKDNTIFKIEIPNNMMDGGKRRIGHDIYIDHETVSKSCKKIKTLEEDNKNLTETINNLKTVLENTRNESKTFKKDYVDIVQIFKETKNELLNARVKIEKQVRDKKVAISICNKLRRKIINTDLAKNK